jgi:hypothetical protein
MEHSDNGNRTPTCYLLIWLLCTYPPVLPPLLIRQPYGIADLAAPMQEI